LLLLLAIDTPSDFRKFPNDSHTENFDGMSAAGICVAAFEHFLCDFGQIARFLPEFTRSQQHHRVKTQAGK
jgi:hypothetical protein